MIFNLIASHDVLGNPLASRETVGQVLTEHAETEGASESDVEQDAAKAGMIHALLPDAGAVVAHVIEAVAEFKLSTQNTQKMNVVNRDPKTWTDPSKNFKPG